MQIFAIDSEFDVDTSEFGRVGLQEEDAARVRKAAGTYARRFLCTNLTLGFRAAGTCREAPKW